MHGQAGKGRQEQAWTGRGRQAGAGSLGQAGRGRPAGARRQVQAGTGRQAGAGRQGQAGTGRLQKWTCMLSPFWETHDPRRMTPGTKPRTYRTYPAAHTHRTYRTYPPPHIPHFHDQTALRKRVLGNITSKAADAVDREVVFI